MPEKNKFGVVVFETTNKKDKKFNNGNLDNSIKEINNFFELENDMVLITRSGTIGVAISTNHPSFDFEDKTYVASGFVITAKIRDGYSADTISNYINLFEVQKYLTSMASGACQKNIAQPIIKNLPIPEVLLTGNAEFVNLFSEYENKSMSLLKEIGGLENQLIELKSDISSSIKKKIIEYYNIKQ